MKPAYTIHGFKTALAAILAYAITIAFEMEFGYWAVISTVIVMQVYVADSVEMCLYRLSGTLIGAALGLAVMLTLPHTQVWLGAALFVTVGLCAFLTRYKTRYRMAAITLVIIIMTGTANPDIPMFVVSRVGEIGLGIICAFGVSVLVFPKRKADVLEHRLTAQARDCDRLCRTLVAAFIHKQTHVETYLMETLVDQVRENQAFFLNIRRHEVKIYRLGDNFQAKVFLMGRVVENLRTMIRILNGLEGPGHEIIMARELNEISRAAGRTFIGLMTERTDCGTDYGSGELADLISRMDQRLTSIRKEGLTTRFNIKRLIQVFSFYNSLKYYAEDILAGAERIRKVKD